MKKKMPKKLVILGRQFKIKIITPSKMEERVGQQAWAAVDFNNKEILLQDVLSDEEMMISIIHEVNHIAHMVSGLNQVISPELCEVLCESTANAFIDLIRSIHK